MKGLPPMSIYRDAQGSPPCWRWSCRVPLCGAHDWHGRRQDAQQAALAHLKAHATIGFQRR